MKPYILSNDREWKWTWLDKSKYRPFVVAISVCLIWMIYLFFYNFNWQTYVLEAVQDCVKSEILPVISVLEHQTTKDLTLFQRIIGRMVPYYAYALSDEQDIVTVNMIGSDDDSKGKGTNSSENADSVGAEGNAAAGKDVSTPIVQDVSGAISTNTAKGSVYQRADLNNNDFLRRNFYTITSITSLDDTMLRAEEFLDKNLAVTHDASTPQILIFHTHSQEAFADSTERDVNTSIVGVGNYLTQLLTEKYGYNVIHDTSVYDYIDGTLDRSKAYTYAENGVQGILDANPSIEVVIDLHRDGVAESTHLVTEQNGKEMSKIMFFNGVSYSNNIGDIGYLYNPNRDENLAMSLQMQLLGEAYYPGFLRNIYINAYRYCLHMRGKSMLIEAGAQTNTVQEEMNAMEPLADMLDKLLRGEKAY